ncbi:MAG TPA: hypothetical protein VF746_01640 [Longimicrobium sp.]
MELLDRYLSEVGAHLPRAERADVVRELSANILAEVEDRSAELGRPLDDAEIEAILTRHGEPMLVAARFRGEDRSLVLGRRRLIGPELFPLYLAFLRINLGITLALFALVAAAALARGEPLPRAAGRVLAFPGVWLPVLVQLAAVTLVFVAWDRWSARRRGSWRFRSEGAYAPPRWATAAGLVVWVLLAAWWAAVPVYPALLFGGAADGLALSPAWRSFHAPVLLLLLAGAAQRTADLARPGRVWPLALTRLLVNGAGLALLYVVSRSYPLVVVADGAGDAEHYRRLARWLNAPALLWWLWPYLLINFAAHLAFCLRRLRRGRGAGPGT